MLLVLKHQDGPQVGIKIHNSKARVLCDRGTEDLFGIVVGQSTRDILQDLVGLHLVLEL